MELDPSKVSIDSVFSGAPYYIDFYQRDYKWDKTPVLRLLNDIFYPFENSYSKNKYLVASEENSEKYPWYYLNTFVTTKQLGKFYIVDGQQRLTTLTLILIKLYHLSIKYELEEDTSNWIRQKICNTGASGKKFLMYHEKCLDILSALLDNKDFNVNDKIITQKNIVGNYIEISDFLDKKLKDSNILSHFIYYFLLRLVLVNLTIMDNNDIPMVFEVINDRGVRLRPYEILKGKLLGQIKKDELDKNNYNEKWDSHIAEINSDREDADEFFKYYLKSKFSNTRNEGIKFDNDYHRVIFSDDFSKELKSCTPGRAGGLNL